MSPHPGRALPDGVRVDVCGFLKLHPGLSETEVNISKHEQRALQVLAQGGAIHFVRGLNGKVRDITCVTRHGIS